MRVLVYSTCLFLFFPFVQVLHAQTSSIRSSLEGQTLLTGQQVPFWMRSNQYGSVPISGASMSLIGRASKEYSVDSTRRRLFDWGAGFEGRANLGSGSNFIPVEAYGKIRLAMFEVKAGRSKDIMGLCDTLLSSGSFAVSGNALGIPKIQLSIPEFYTLPILGRWISFKGNWSHGWLGELPTGVNNVSAITYFHQKSLYGRFGKPGGSLQFIGGFSHQAFWGNENNIFGNSYTMSNIESYNFVVQGRNWAGSKVGNHLGSIDVAFEKLINNFKLLVYRQNFYDTGALYYLANIRDGLNGISITNRGAKTDKLVHWDKVLLEVLATKNQGGQVWNRFTPSGAENYYNSYIYERGWSYLNTGLGNPLISNQEDVKQKYSDLPGGYFINNRVVAIHAGFVGSVKNWHIITRSTYSWNYGTYSTSGVPYRIPFGRIAEPEESEKFGSVKQFSTNFSASKELNQNKYCGVDLAVDLGGLFNPTLGLRVKYGVKF